MSVALPSSGSFVRVRHRHWLVEDAIAPPEAGQSALIRLSCIEDDAQGENLEVLWDIELDAEILASDLWPRIGGASFDETGTFAAYLHTLRWSAVTATDPTLLQAPFRAGIKIDAY